MAKSASSMRLSIAVSVAAFALVAILAQSFALIMAFKEKEEEFIDDVLSSQMTRSMAAWHTHPALAFPNTPDMQLYRLAPEQPLPAGLAPEINRLPVGNHEIELAGREYHVAVRADPEARYILVYDVDAHEHRLQAIASIILGGAFLLAAVILFGSYWLAGRLAARLERLAARVAADDSGALSEVGMEAEVLALAQALEVSRRRQAQAIERERDFAANLSHELRTPLTLIRTDAELIAAGDLPEAVVRRGRRIIDSVDRINATAASLLMLARAAGPRDAQEVDLAGMIALLWEAMVPPAEQTPPSLVVEVPAGTRVVGDPAFVELVLRNLLDNAIRHGRAKTVRCTLAGTTLRIADDGPGFAVATLPEVFDRLHSRQHGGLGLGLALVRHACEASGWHVQAGNGAAGGGEVCVDFAASLRSPGEA